MPDALLIAEFPMLGKAYQFANGLPDEVQLLEAFGAAPKAHVICRGKPKQVHELAKDISALVIENEVETLLSVFYSLQFAPIEKNLFIFESGSLIEVFRTASSWLKQGVLIHDMKISRSSQDAGYVFGTSSMPSQEFQLGGDVITLSPLRHQLQKFFDTEIP